MNWPEHVTSIKNEKARSKYGTGLPFSYTTRHRDLMIRCSSTCGMC